MDNPTTITTVEDAKAAIAQAAAVLETISRDAIADPEANLAANKCNLNGCTLSGVNGPSGIVVPR